MEIYTVIELHTKSGAMFIHGSYVTRAEALIVRNERYIEIHDIDSSDPSLEMIANDDVIANQGYQYIVMKSILNTVG